MQKLEYKRGIISYEYYLKNSKKEINENYNWIKSIICYVIPYPNTSHDDKYLPAKFALGRDYHKVVKEFLEEEAKKEKLNKFETFVDISFLDEKLCSCLAGLGVRGKNDLFISNEYGSFVYLGEIVTDKVYQYNEVEVKECINCGKCIEKCPNNALENGFDKTKCLSFLSQKPSINFSLFSEMEKYYGCDICQEVCPMNKQIKHNSFVFDIDDKSKMNLEKLENILDYKEFSSDKTFSWIGYLKMLRNIIVLEVKNNNISLEKINYYQKKYKDVKWFYEHLEFLKGENKNGNN